MYLKKKEKENNLKRQTGKSGFMKAAKKCVAARLTQCCTGEHVRADLKLCDPLTVLPTAAHVLNFWTRVHVFPSPVGPGHIHVHCKFSVCANSVCHMTTVYKQSVSRYRTPELFWPPLPMHTIRVSGLHVEVSKPRSPGQIPPALWHSAPGFK